MIIRAVVLLVALPGLFPVQATGQDRPEGAAAGAVAATERRGVVAGVVRSSEGREPVAYARVQVLGDSIADWSDADGTYRLTGLSVGAIELRIAHPGHDSLRVALSIPPDRPVRLDITLDARPGPAVDALADFEPFQVDFTLPALANPDQISALLHELYPPELMRRGVGGEAVLRIWLDEAGRVVRSIVSSSSGHPALDSIALTVSDSMRFRPARNRQEGVRVYVRIPILFTVPAVSVQPAG